MIKYLILCMSDLEFSCVDILVYDGEITALFNAVESKHRTAAVTSSDNYCYFCRAFVIRFPLHPTASRRS